MAESSDSAQGKCSLVPLHPTWQPVDIHVGFECQLGRLKSLPPAQRFTDGRISGKHCTLTVDPDTRSLRITDQGSTNGTFVNGMKLQAHVACTLKDGDKVSLGVSNPTMESGLPSYLVCAAHEDLDRTVEIVSGKRVACDSEEEGSLHEEERGEPARKRKKVEKESPNAVSQTSNLSSEAAPCTSSSSSSPPCSFSSTTTTTASAAASSSSTSSSSSSSSSIANPKIEEELQCVICQLLFYKAVTLLPCLHTFCGPCLSMWTANQKTTCPTCRQAVDAVQKNHTINNLLEAYLEQNPSLKRTAEDMEELDKVNIFKENSTQLRKPGRGGRGRGRRFRNHSDEEEDSFSGSSDMDYDTEEEEDLGLGILHPRNIPRCLECTAAGPDGFQCPAWNGPHIPCAFCNRVMPVRGPDCQRVQKCQGCDRVACDKYWETGCTALHGKLGKIKDWQMVQIPAQCLNRNVVEKEILQEYMQSKNLSAQDVWRACVAKLEAAEFTCDKLLTRIQATSEHILCRNCATIVFTDLLYQYRASIPKEELPEWVGRRVDCWYGRHCRTQGRNPDHARRLNHICEQTR